MTNQNTEPTHISKAMPDFQELERLQKQNEDELRAEIQRKNTDIKLLEDEINKLQVQLSEKTRDNHELKWTCIRALEYIISSKPHELDKYL
jgi:chromosome segregation ATPase